MDIKNLKHELNVINKTNNGCGKAIIKKKGRAYYF